MLLSADSLLWLLGSKMLESQSARWVAQVEAHGWSVSAGDQSGGGWPFLAQRTFERVAIAGGDRYLPGGLTWSADRLVLTVSLLHPMRLVLSAEGQQFLRLSHLPDIGFTAVHALARLPLLTGQGAAGDLQVTGISGGIAGSRHPQDVQVESLWLRARQNTQDEGQKLLEVQIDVLATGIGLPDIGRWPLGATVTSAGASLRLSSPPLPSPPAAASPGQSRVAAQAAAWRDDGGSLAVRDAVLRWGPLSLSGSADLGLDSRLQPAGSGTADVSGSEPALDAAAQGGIISPGLAMTAKAVLAVMPRAPGGDAIRLPFQLRNSTVSVGQIPLARLGDIGWDRNGP